MPVVYSLVGLVAGIFIGLIYPGYIPQNMTSYVAVGILAALDSVFGSINANCKGKFSLGIFASGFFVNTLVAVFLTYVGNLLQIDLYLAAVVVFGTRIFQNLAEIRRFILNYNRKNSNI
jgi:small basic protein